MIATTVAAFNGTGFQLREKWYGGAAGMEIRLKYLAEPAPQSEFLPMAADLTVRLYDFDNVLLCNLIPHPIAPQEPYSSAIVVMPHANTTQE